MHTRKYRTSETAARVVRRLCAGSLLPILVVSLAGVVPPADARPPREVQAGRMWVDPQRTFLVTTSEDAVVRDSVPIELARFGIAPGSQIHLRRVGDFSTNGPAAAEPQEGITEKDGLIGVFSRSATLSAECKQVPPAQMLPCDRFNRVTDAIDWPGPNAGSPLEVRTPPYAGGVITDIPHDFLLTDNRITVPEGATHLFVAAHDDAFRSAFTDNRDLGIDFILEIYRVSAPGVDELSVRVGGYSNSGVLSRGNFAVSGAGDLVMGVRGSGVLPGVAGGEATVTVSLNRFLIFPLYFGDFTVRDGGSRFAKRGMLWFGSVTKAGTRVSITSPAADFGTFPWWFGSVSLTIIDDG